MACVSDIDLATLHRNRLEERVHYKLSWWARRMISNTLNERTNTTTSDTNGIRHDGIPKHNTLINLSSPASQTPTTTTTTNRYNGLPPQSPPTITGRGRRHTDRHRDIVRQNNQNNGNESLDGIEDDLETFNLNDRRIYENRYKDEDYFTTERRRRSGTWP